MNPAPFEPTLSAALARLAAVRPGDYARSRNHLDGAVTRLSPYITHGFLTLPEVLAAVPVQPPHKFLQELAWREYFHHVWRHLGDGIFTSLHEGVLPDAAYAPRLPLDIRQGATGVPVIDQAVRALYATGWLHNHARLWLASYVVHMRKVHWRAGADWLYGHLLDGDLASNHLSWQWVAGTGSSNPYLFNADNVARYAPPPWHSPGTPVDASYERLEAVAHSLDGVPVAGGAGVPEPPLLAHPPPELALGGGSLPASAWVLHPWVLREAPEGHEAVGVFDARFHLAWPWSAMRWRFVTARMAMLAPRCLWLEHAPHEQARSVDDPHLRGHWSLHKAQAVPRIFADPQQRCASFSQFWKQVQGPGQAPGPGRG